MENAISTTTPTPEELADRGPRRWRWVTPLVIGLLLIIRMGVLGVAGLLLTGPLPWLIGFYETSTYILTLFLILWERERLAEFNITWMVVGIILILKPLETLILQGDGMPGMAMAFPSPWAIAVWIAAGVALAALIILRRASAVAPAELAKAGAVPMRSVRADWRWLGFGLLVGLALSVVLAVPLMFQLKQAGQIYRGATLWMAALMFPVQFLYQLGYAAVSEEPLFRGFLWGWLRRVGWADKWIWLFQALLFSLSHIYYITRAPLSFWIVVPLGALVMGWVAWRARSITASMAAHATLNALGTPLANVLGNLF